MAALIGGAAVVGVWLSRYAVAVHRLTRGIGDTVFYGADGQPWFRLDEQRHDVSLAEIAPECCPAGWDERLEPAGITAVGPLELS